MNGLVPVIQNVASRINKLGVNDIDAIKIVENVEEIYKKVLENREKQKFEEQNSDKKEER